MQGTVRLNKLNPIHIPCIKDTTIKFQWNALTVDKYLNCIITKYTLLHVSAWESHLQENLYTKEWVINK